MVTITWVTLITFPKLGYKPPYPALPCCDFGAAHARKQLPTPSLDAMGQGGCQWQNVLAFCAVGGTIDNRGPLTLH